MIVSFMFISLIEYRIIFVFKFDSFLEFTTLFVYHSYFKLNLELYFHIKLFFLIVNYLKFINILVYFLCFSFIFDIVLFSFNSF